VAVHHYFLGADEKGRGRSSCVICGGVIMLACPLAHRAGGANSAECPIGTSAAPSLRSAAASLAGRLDRAFVRQCHRLLRREGYNRPASTASSRAFLDLILGVPDLLRARCSAARVRFRQRRQVQSRDGAVPSRRGACAPHLSLCPSTPHPLAFCCVDSEHGERSGAVCLVNRLEMETAAPNATIALRDQHRTKG